MKTETIREELVSLDLAGSFFGSQLFGPEEIEAVHGIRVSQPPPIPFSRTELIRASGRGDTLVLRDPHGFLTMQAMCKRFENRLAGEPILSGGAWYLQEPFFTEEVCRPGWALVRNRILPASFGGGLLGETKALAEHAETVVYEGGMLPAQPKVAGAEWQYHKRELSELGPDDWHESAARTVVLLINKFYRERMVEVLYTLILDLALNKNRMLREGYMRTNSLTQEGRTTVIGRKEGEGWQIGLLDPIVGHDTVGTRFSY